MEDTARPERCVLGLDVGGTKCAGGVLEMPSGRIVCRRSIPTRAFRGGQAVLDDVMALAVALRDEARGRGCEPRSGGIGVAELVSPQGRVLSAATIAWEGLSVGALVEAAIGLPVHVDADVRAAARGEARLGAGRGLGSFLYVTIGTGISSAIVIEGRPHTGARGLTGTFASGPALVADEGGALVSGVALESFASGPALARRFAAQSPGFDGSAEDVVRSAESGDAAARSVVESAGQAVGAAIAHLVNLLDPEAVVVGGGLGLVEGLYRRAMDRTLRAHIWSPIHRDLPLFSATLGTDAGWIGAALEPEPLKGVRGGQS